MCTVWFSYHHETEYHILFDNTSVVDWCPDFRKIRRLTTFIYLIQSPQTNLAKKRFGCLWLVQVHRTLTWPFHDQYWTVIPFKWFTSGFIEKSSYSALTVDSGYLASKFSECIHFASFLMKVRSRITIAVNFFFLQWHRTYGNA